MCQVWCLCSQRCGATALRCVGPPLSDGWGHRSEVRGATALSGHTRRRWGGWGVGAGRAYGGVKGVEAGPKRVRLVQFGRG